MITDAGYAILANQWQPIETVPEGEHVLLYFAVGEKGNGGMECATVFRNGDRFNYWTHGGPNSGESWWTHDGELPTHWARLPLPPKTP